MILYIIPCEACVIMRALGGLKIMKNISISKLIRSKLLHAWRLVTLAVASFAISFIPMGASALPSTTRATNDTLHWGNCAPPPPGLPDAGQQCATLSVPLNYQSPSGRHISVAVSRVHAADPTKRRGVLFTNPGGPGGSGLDLPRVMTILLTQNVLDEYDIIGFDPRGVGASTPVTCGMTADQANQAFVPLTQNNSFTDTATFAKKVADSCASHSGDLLPYITTNNTARDMDQIRSALGESKISYLGYSYGTYLGAVYSSLFAAHTDRIVLDSNVSPTAVWRLQFRSWGFGGAIRFPDFASYAANNDATYHLGGTQDQITQKYYALLGKVSAHPITLPDGTVIDGPMFRELTFGLLYNDADFPGLAGAWRYIDGQVVPLQAVERAIKNSAMTPQTVSASVPADNAAAAGLAVVCDDVAWSHSVPQYQQELNFDKTIFPMFGELGSNIYPCAFWHNQPVEPLTNISSVGASNILMIQNIRDLATPYIGALDMHLRLGNRSHLVSVDQGGHAVSYLMLNACANDSTTAFLADGTLPVHDKWCPAESMPSARSFGIQNSAHDAAADVIRRQMGM